MLLEDLPTELLVMVVENVASFDCQVTRPSLSEAGHLQCAVNVDSLFALSAVNRYFRAISVPYLWEKTAWRMCRRTMCTPTKDGRNHIHPYMCEYCQFKMITEPDKPVYELPQSLWHRIQNMSVMARDFHALLQIFCEARYYEQLLRASDPAKLKAPTAVGDETSSRPYIRPPDSLLYLTVWNDNEDTKAARNVISCVLNEKGIHIANQDTAAKSWRKMLRILPPLLAVYIRRRGELDEWVRSRYYREQQNHKTPDDTVMVKAFNGDTELYDMPWSDVAWYLDDSDQQMEKIANDEIAARQADLMIRATSNGIANGQAPQQVPGASSKPDSLNEDRRQPAPTIALPRITDPGQPSTPTQALPPQTRRESSVSFTASLKAKLRRWRI